MMRSQAAQYICYEKRSLILQTEARTNLQKKCNLFAPCLLPAY